MAEEFKLMKDEGVPVIPVLEEVADPNAPDGGKVSSTSVSSGMNLISHGVEEAITGDVVKSMLIPETLDLMVPNYVIDFRNVGKVRKHQLMALMSIITDEGDTAIYVCLENGMEKLGMGVGVDLDRILPPGIQSIFGDKCTLYKDVTRDEPPKMLKQQDITKMRLRL